MSGSGLFNPDAVADGSGSVSDTDGAVSQPHDGSAAPIRSASRGSIPVRRFIERMDQCINRNDLKGARECIRFWEKEARELGDDRGLLTVLNEAVGYYRHAKKRTRAIEAMEESLTLVEKLGLTHNLSGATVYINAATTLSFFDREEEALGLYARAAACYEEEGRTQTYEYAALLNNQAATQHVLKRYDEAEENWFRAVEILQQLGGHDGDVAISLVMLAHLSYERDGGPRWKIDSLLDEAWDYLHAEGQERDGRYAFALRKCAPSFDYFGRGGEAKALRDTAGEITRGFRAGET